jgi:hypothetical protein
LTQTEPKAERNKTLLSVSPSSHFFFISTTSFELNSSHFNSTSISSPSGLSVRSIHSLEPGGFDRADLLAGTSKRLLLKDKDRKTLISQTSWHIQLLASKATSCNVRNGFGYQVRCKTFMPYYLHPSPIF